MRSLDSDGWSRPISAANRWVVKEGLAVVGRGSVFDGFRNPREPRNGRGLRMRTRTNRAVGGKPYSVTTRRDTGGNGERGGGEGASPHVVPGIALRSRRIPAAGRARVIAHREVCREGCPRRPATPLLCSTTKRPRTARESSCPSKDRQRLAPVGNAGDHRNRTASRRPPFLAGFKRGREWSLRSLHDKVTSMPRRAAGASSPEAPGAP